MIRNPNAELTDPPRVPTLWEILEDVTARRMNGEEVPDDSVIASNAQLMPELRERLAALRVVEEARRAASSSVRTPAFGLDDSSRGPWAVDSFPGYEVRELVGRGACGAVYRAFHPATRREVAIKAMLEGPLTGANERTRFEREARILAQLKHPHIVAIHDTGWTQGRFYLVMDFVEGEPLDTFVARQELSIRERLALFASICEAAHAAHLRGVIHRDLKPRNILIDEECQPHLLDFGLAKLSTDTTDPLMSSHSMTMTGQFIGSLPWASPEQAEGVPSRIDLRTDIYSLGVMLYQILTGGFPYSIVGNIRDVIDRILTSEPEKPSRVRDDIDDEIETIVLKCLSKDRERRYQSAGDFAKDIRRYLNGETIEAKRDSTWYVFRKAMGRHRWAAAVGVGFVLLSSAYGVTMSLLYHREQREAQRTQQTLAFLNDTLFSASSQRLGADATLTEVLDYAAQRLSKEFGSEPLVAAKLHSTIGSAYETIWRKGDGARHLRRAMELYRENLGAEDAETLKTAVYLGMVLAEDGNRQAVPLLRNALATRHRTHGDHDLIVADAQTQLAFAVWHVNDPPNYDEADALYHEALATYQDFVGPEHEDIARMLTGWASMLRSQGRIDEALVMYRRALAMAEKLLTSDHQFVLECKMGYADALQAAGQSAEAEAVLEPVLNRAARRFGADAVPWVMGRLATFKQSQGNLDGARRTLVQNLVYRCRDFAARDPDQQARWEELADALDREPAAGTLAELYRKTVRAILEQNRSAFDAVRALSALADLELDAGRYAAAELLLSDALPLVGRLSPSASWRAGSVRAGLGKALMELGRPGEAEPLLIAGQSALERSLGPSDKITHQATQALVNLFESTGRAADADAWRAKLLPQRP